MYHNTVLLRIICVIAYLFRFQIQQAVPCVCAWGWKALCWYCLVGQRWLYTGYQHVLSCLYIRTTVSTLASFTHPRLFYMLLLNEMQVKIETPAQMKKCNVNLPFFFLIPLSIPVCRPRLLLLMAHGWSVCWRSLNWGKQISMSTTLVERTVPGAILNHTLLWYQQVQTQKI